MSKTADELQYRELLAQVAEHLGGCASAGIPAQWFRTAAPPAGCLPAPSGTAELQAGGAEFQTLMKEALGCTKCRLHKTRRNVVFGAGCAVQPPIAFVGEGPGADEDRMGEPFVGRAGELLTAAITKGLRLRREDVYICNVVKCRPPSNRTPLPDEVESCAPFLFRQLELVQPRIIVTLGGPAQQALCGRPGGITRLRGSWLEWRGIKVMPTFHPAYILRNPSAKRPFWEDLQEVVRELGLHA